MSQTTQKTALPTEAVEGILRKIMPAIAGGVGTAGLTDAYQNQGDYTKFDKMRILNLIVNSGLGAAGGHAIAHGQGLRGAELIAGAPLKDAIFAAPGLMRQSTEWMKNHSGEKSSDGFSGLQKGLMLGGGALALGAAIPALHNISMAAKRIGSGHAVRVSTSVRHNNRYNDDPADSDAPVIVVPQEKPEKGFLRRLLHI